MTITLADISAATSTYLHDEVRTEIKDVTANLNPGESGTFTVSITNAAAPTGVRLRDLTIHLKVSDANVAQLKAVDSVFIDCRETGDPSTPQLPRDTLVEEMFVFLVQTIEPNATLDVGEVLELEFPFRAAGAGRVDFSAHIHATVVPEDLLPRTRGTDAVEGVRVRP